jgi:TolB-like protein/tetratricopeptide (TPR) repeat protein
MNKLLAELRRRNVFRVAAAYLVVGWLVMQIVSVMTPALQLPGWVDGFFAVFLIALLPIALLLAWAFEMTPAGVKKTVAVDGDVEFRPLGGTDFVLIGLMVVLLGVVGFQMISPGDAPVDVADPSEVATAPITDIEPAEAPAVDASIAVLPFADFSPGGDQQYFSDGISEELLNALAQFPDLRVAARTSAFSFRGDDVDLREVGQTLGVAHVLEGSVRHSGDRIRITAQLIRVSDGFHLWSETYERTMTDVFEIQDDIVTELSRVLQVRLGVGGGAGRASAGLVDPSAYEQYLLGLSLWGQRNVGQNRRQAVQAFAQATQIDPGFADGWASYGQSLAMSPIAHLDMTGERRNQLALAALNRALELDPDNARAHVGLSALYTEPSLNIELAIEEAQRAYEIAPNAGYINYNMAHALFFSGDIEGALRHLRRARTIDSLNDLPILVQARFLAQTGQISRSQAVQSECMTCDAGGNAWLHWYATLAAGTPEQARRAATELVYPQDDALADTEAGREEIRGYIAVNSDFTEAYLGTENTGALVLEVFENEFADTVDASLFARLGEDQRAIDVLFRDYGRVNGVLDLMWILHPGRFELPERTRRLPRYHEFWALPGMPELAAARRANGQTAGLPLPSEG